MLKKFIPLRMAGVGNRRAVLKASLESRQTAATSAMSKKFKDIIVLLNQNFIYFVYTCERISFVGR